MSEEEWELAFVSSAVESDAGKDDNKGIFITRYVFKRIKKAAKMPLFVTYSSLFLDDLWTLDVLL